MFFPFQIVLAFFGSLSIVMVASPAFAVPPRYHATELGFVGSEGGDLGTVGLGLNNAGHVVGFSSIPRTEHAFLWIDEQMVDIGVSGGADSSTIAYGINIHDQVVGLWSVDSKPRAFLWQAGTMSRLPPLPDANRAAANEINNFGVIVGSSWLASDNANLCERPTIWKPIKDQPGKYRAIEIDLPGSNRCGVALDINDSSLSIGVYWPSTGGIRSFIANNKVATQIRGLVYLHAINASGQVLADRFDSQTGKVQTVIWKDGVTTKVGIRGFGFNNRGHVVGALDDCCTRTAAIWMDGVAYDLQSLVADVSMGTDCIRLDLQNADTINSRGQIVANGLCVFASGGFRVATALLTPIK